jgi:hypothetical protein
LGREGILNSVKKLALVVGVFGVAAGVGLMIAGLGTNGFHSCGSGGSFRGDPEPTNPCPHSTDVLVIVGVLVMILGILMPLVLSAVFSWRAARRKAPTAGEFLTDEPG